MVRKRVMRPDLEEKGVMLNQHGIEIGRMTFEGNLVLDPLAVYLGMEREAAKNYGRVKKTWIYKNFGRYGTWAYDPSVDALLDEMVSLGRIFLDKDPKYYRLLGSVQRVARDFPPYVTSKQLLAGLEHLEDE